MGKRKNRYVSHISKKNNQKSILTFINLDAHFIMFQGEKRQQNYYYCSLLIQLSLILKKALLSGLLLDFNLKF